jgi:DNA-binding NarL/FixJ family response regulator
VTPIRLAVIDDHPLYREGVARSLGEIGGFEIVGQGASRDDAIALAESCAPDVLLIDLSMPGGGLAALAELLRRRPDQKIVVLTVSESSDDVACALNHGARGYVLKGVGSKTLAEVLRTVVAGESYLSPTLAARLLSDVAAGRERHDPIAELNERERQVLSLVASGLSNKRIALRLGLQEKTIKYYMTRILTKLQVSNRTEAAMVLRNSAGASLEPSAAISLPLV